VTELAGDVDDAAAFVEQEAREAVAQRVGRGLVDLCCLARGGAVVGEHERVPRRSAGGEAPLGEVCFQRREQPHGSVRRRLGVGVLAERERALDEQRVVADVVPLQREGFARSKAGVGEDGEQRRAGKPRRASARRRPVRAVGSPCAAGAVRGGRGGPGWRRCAQLRRRAGGWSRGGRGHGEPRWARRRRRAGRSASARSSRPGSLAVAAGRGSARCDGRRARRSVCASSARASRRAPAPRSG